MNEEFINNVEENIEDLPEEVRDFIFGEELKATKKALVDTVDNAEEKLTLSNTLMFFLLGGKTEKELSDCIDTLTISEEKKVAIKVTIQEKIINELLILIEAHTQIDDAVNETSLKPTVTTSLTSLSDRLKQTTIAPPVKRDYSAEGEVTTPHAIDPYHESIDNE